MNADPLIARHSFLMRRPRRVSGKIGEVVRGRSGGNRFVTRRRIPRSAILSRIQLCPGDIPASVIIADIAAGNLAPNRNYPSALLGITLAPP